MHLGAVRTALRGSAPGAVPEVDARNLRYAFEVEHGVKNRMIGLQVDYRVLARRQHLSNLRRPDVPCVRSPEVVHPEKATFQEVRSEADGVFVAEEQRADLLHHDERTLIQLVVCEPDDQMTRRFRAIEADRDLCELGKPDRE